VKSSTPEASGHRVGRSLEAFGRASQAEVESEPPGAACTLLRLDREDEGVAQRLLDLGASGLGGVHDGGIDGEGPWLVRRIPNATLASRFRAEKGAWPWRDALATALGIARALIAAEKASLFAGPLSPDHVACDGAQCMLPADRLFGAMLGVTSASGLTQSAPSPLWTPPAQADGAPWDAAANRYALGLLLYRMIGGDHPFSGAGLRHAIEAAQREAPPFEETIARGLPSGLQSTILRMLDPDVAHRPSSATSISDTLQRFLDGVGLETANRSGGQPRRTQEPRERKRPTQPSEAEPARKAVTPPAQKTRWAGRSAIQIAWPIALGLLVALGALTLLDAPPKTSRRARPDTEREALRAGTTLATDCASCHPRQAAEWRRSVMAHSVKSPLFNALESLIEEQVGRDRNCPNGAGLLRRTSDAAACRVPATGLPISGAGGEHWCVNCHSPADNLGSTMPVWQGKAGGDPQSRLPVRDLLSDAAKEGISCGFCHQVHGPVGPRGSGGYEGNPTWRSFITGTVFEFRPEDRLGNFGIGNSGYDLRPDTLLIRRIDRDIDPDDPAPPGVHARPSPSTKAYLRSSEFCGSCHDVRLVGTDVLGVKSGDHFKRLRNAYTEWALWKQSEERAGRKAASCQDCHMSTFPGVCIPDEDGEGDGGCPPGTRFKRRKPGGWPEARVAENSPALLDVTTHYFSGVDLPLSDEVPDEIIDEGTLDLNGIPISARRRRDMLLQASMKLDVEPGVVRGQNLEIPVVIENVGAGHRVPAGFSQEREVWVHLRVEDKSGRTLYEVGRVEQSDEDLHDKVFLRVNTNPNILDAQGAPVGLFGADVRDGPDAPAWSPPPILGGASFRGRGLINFQNGFLRCVRCIGEIAPDGTCLAGPGQGRHRADRFEDGEYDIDTGACRSNLFGQNALFETYFPVGALDASRGGIKAADAIVDTRSLPPGIPVRYTYVLPTRGARGPFIVTARLLFRAFPPFLLRAFADYEREQDRLGHRPSGPSLEPESLSRLEIVEIAEVRMETP